MWETLRKDRTFVVQTDRLSFPSVRRAGSAMVDVNKVAQSWKKAKR